MIKDVLLPEISENVESGDVIELLVKVGDFVELEQSIVQLETEKAAFDVPSSAKGKVVELLVAEGQTVNVGQLIAKIDTDAQPGAEPAAPEPVAAAVESKPAEQAPPPPPEPKEEPVQEVKQPEPAPVAAEPKPSAASKPTEVVAAAPSVRQLAREMGVDLHQVTGSAPGGRVTKEDLIAHAKGATGSGTTPSVGQPVKALPDFTKWGEVERKKASVTRKKIAETLSFAWSTVPQVTQNEHADITLLEEFRKEYGDEVRQAGGKLTVTSILLKAVTMALQKFPNFNTSYDPQTQEVIYKKYYHMAVAVDTDRGLLVPVIRDVDKKTLLEVSVELSQIAEKAKTNKVTPDEMMGGTFTISNLGGIGGSSFSPIIYWPQTGILGVSRSVRQPVYVDDAIQPRLMMPLSLTYDHRIIDGAEGIRFLRYIVELLEKPFLLAVHDSDK